MQQISFSAMSTKDLLHEVAGFADSAERIGTMSELADAVTKIVAPLGYSGVASGRLGNIEQTEALHFATWHPAWIEHYFTNGYVRVDPVPMWGIRSGYAVSAAELRARLPKGHPGHDVFEAAKEFGYVGAYIVPQRAADGGFGVVCFVGANDPQSQQERTGLRALASIVFERAELLAGRPPPTELPLPPPALTTQERECLKHLVAGRKAAEIARLMQISEATVRFHSNNLRQKTGTSSLAELAAIAIATGLIPNS
jgi:DNA-binding CsgD family transcriptional regulator